MLALSFLAERPVYPVPEKYDPVKARVREDYEELYQDMMNTLWNRQAVLVIFPPIEKRYGLPTMEEVTTGLEILWETNDGLIFGSHGFDPTDVHGEKER
jgi:hypothetical protein